LSAEPITPVRWLSLIGLLLLIVVAGVALLRAIGSHDASPPVQNGRQVADFTLPDVNGQPVNLRSYVGDRPFVLTFGSTTCPYCDLQREAFKELREKYGSRLALLEINVGEPRSRVAAYIERTGSPFTTLLDGDGSIFLRYGSSGIPVTVVADSEGQIITVDNYIPAGRLMSLLKLDDPTI
jgi:peroxiredoxin